MADRTSDPHCTVRVKGKDWTTEPAVAVTVTMYVPCGVPAGPDDPDDPPPQESRIANAAIAITVLTRRTVDPLGRCAIGKTNIPHPRIAVAHNQWKDEFRKFVLAILGAAVFTVTERVEALVALTVTLLGAEQTEFAGAPVHVKVAVAESPSPPMLIV